MSLNIPLFVASASEDVASILSYINVFVLFFMSLVVSKIYMQCGVLACQGWLLLCKLHKILNLNLIGINILYDKN